VIVVLGGTGRLGSLVVRGLSEQGLRVRVVSRHPSERGLPLGVESVHADVRDARAVGAAVEGARTIVSAMHGFAGTGGVSPRAVDRDGNAHLIAAAKRISADLVLLSVINASASSSVSLFRMKYAAEQLAHESGIAWTAVRSEAFAETWVDVLEQSAGRGQVPLVFGRGANKVSWVSVEDVAALVCRAVEDTALRGRVVNICGPEPMTLTELAELVMARRGWAGQPRHVPRAALVTVAATLGLVHPEIGRKARAALAMDLLPTARDAATRDEFPDLPCTPVSDVVARDAPLR